MPAASDHGAAFMVGAQNLSGHWIQISRKEFGCLSGVDNIKLVSYYSILSEG